MKDEAQMASHTEEYRNHIITVFEREGDQPMHWRSSFDGKYAGGGDLGGSKVENGFLTAKSQIDNTLIECIERLDREIEAGQQGRADRGRFVPPYMVAPLQAAREAIAKL